MLAVVAAICVALAAWAGDPAQRSEGDPPLPTPQQAVERMQEAQKAFDGAPTPLLARVAEQDVTSATELAKVLGAIRAAQGEANDQRDALLERRRLFKADQERAALSGTAAGPVSALLFRHRKELPTEQALRLGVATAQQRAAAAEITSIDLGDAVAALRDPLAAATRMAQEARADLVQVPALATALERRRDLYLKPLWQAQQAYAARLAELATGAIQMHQVVEEYRSFLSVQMLWLPNDKPMTFEDAPRAWEELRLFASAEFWQEIMAGVRASVREYPERWAADTLLIAGLLVFRRKIGSKIRASGQAVGTPSDRFSNSVSCLLWTLLWAAPLPAFFFFYGRLLMLSPNAGTYMTGFARALEVLAGFATLCSLLAALTRPGGLADVHFAWPAPALATLRRGVRLARDLGLPLLFVSVTSFGASLESGSSAISRLSFIAAMLILGAVTARVFNPSRGIFAKAIHDRPNSWLSTLRGVWYPVLVAVPFVQAVGAIAGYVLTTLVILRNLVETYMVLLALAVGLSMLERLFQATTDRFAWRRGTNTDEQRRQAEQATRIIRLATWLLLASGVIAAWSDMVPAFGQLREITVWNITGDDPEHVKSVTAYHLLGLGVILVVTVQLVRDLPGLLNMAVLQRFPLDESARYALVSLGRYVLVVAGVVAGLSALQIGWNNVQWLAAAVTVGLGFGLQEIFANFVSGLIMLAERPVRIGDVVTVDTVTGRVANIATRATTLVDADEKEIIIPNKQFITGRITNWTLDAAPLRFVLTVGVEYGTDLAKAENTLREVAESLPLVVRDPAPMVVLREFGTSSIEFQVWYYVARPVDNTPTRHEMMKRIDQLFRERKIAIAFPQMDVRIAGLQETLEAVKK